MDRPSTAPAMAIVASGVARRHRSGDTRVTALPGFTAPENVVAARLPWAPRAELEAGAAVGAGPAAVGTAAAASLGVTAVTGASMIAVPMMLVRGPVVDALREE